MREFKYISPSSLSKFYSSREEFYKSYLAENYLERDPSTRPMLLGSGFDAFVKNELMRCLKGGESVMLGKPFHLQTLFNKQVQEGEHRQWAWETGGKLFLDYKDCGAFDTLFTELSSGTDIEFEHEVFDELTLPSGLVVKIRGFVDLCYKNKEGLVIVDWKCNNHCGKRKMSPKPFYIIRRPSLKPHRSDFLVDRGVLMTSQCFSKIDKKWAEQLVIYSWMLGSPIGDPCVLQIEQLLGVPDGDCEIVTYRGSVSEEFQLEVVNKIERMFKTIKSGHIFDEVSRTESDKICSHLESTIKSRMSNSVLWDMIRARK